MGCWVPGEHDSVGGEWWERCEHRRNLPSSTSPAKERSSRIVISPKPQKETHLGTFRATLNLESIKPKMDSESKRDTSK